MRLLQSLYILTSWWYSPLRCTTVSCPVVLILLALFSAIEVLDIDIATVDVSVSLSACYSMMFTAPILEADFEATAALILESYTAMSGKKETKFCCHILSRATCRGAPQYGGVRT